MTIINRLSDLILLLILLGAIAWVFEPARGDDRLEGLTPAQRAQVADPNNPQFAPPWPPQRTINVESEQTTYVFKNAPGPTEEQKADALRRAYAPRPVATIPIVPDPAPAPPMLHKVHIKPDICARHGMRKVATRNGKSWRCK